MNMHALGIGTGSQGLNNFQSMPVLPGASAPVAITGAAAKNRSKGKGQARGRGCGGGKGGKGGRGADVDDDVTHRPVSKKDEELYQIDLMRKQVLLAKNAESCMQTGFADF